ncbi:MAG: hypothetical protein L0G94_10675 [Brachybacterium sp.]|uniref:hypothetical protein n=1 Tax=Brachybacterium sp. TaxID=1891286 RepID=UPI002648CA1F|nr:hypothetical protein [Brachybacterium sp.]MDN5687120.1 hypothetical protein [Brachybacterium sp.]
MGVISRIREAVSPAVNGAGDMVEVLSESVRDLSLQLEDRGWKKIGQDDENTLTREALVQAAQDGRALAVAHPLVRRGISLRTSYVHGQGGPQVSVESDDAGDVNSVVQAWWESRENQNALTGPEARTRLERSLSTDGNVFIVCFTNPSTGEVTNRTIPMEQITRIISNPEDRMQVWFYERTYARRPEAFSMVEESVTVLYPALAYAPAVRPHTINGHKVLWDQPVRHVKVNDLDGWDYGIGDTFSIAPWARAYRDFLGDWVKLMRSLSQFAWRASADGKRAQKARQALQRAQQGVPGNDGSAGATYVHGAGENLEAIPKTGATIDADSGRPILAMIAAGLDVPVTMLSTDPGVTGARATAETLDKPMMLAMRARQDVWTAVFVDIAEYRIEQAIRAGKLPGAVVRDAWTQTDHAELDGAEPVIHCDWPDLSTETVEQAVTAIRDADSTGKLPPLVIARLLLTALGVEDIDDVLEELTDDDGEWRDPYAQLGQGLVNAFQRGEDPAQALSQYGRFPTDTAAAEAKVRRDDQS